MMTILSRIAAVVMLLQAMFMAAEWLCGWCFAVAIWRCMSLAERQAGHGSFAQAEQWRRELLIGRLSWTFYCLARWYQIAPRVAVYLVRKAVRRG